MRARLFLRWGFRRAYGSCTVLAALALLESIAVAVHLQDVDVVGEAVEPATAAPVQAAAMPMPSASAGASSSQSAISTEAAAAGEGTGSHPATGVSGLPDAAAHEQKLNERSRNVDENKGAGFKEVAAAASLESPVAYGGEPA